MPEVILSKRTRFCASHRLHSDALSDEENVQVYDKCNSTNGHGHNYQLWVHLKGEVDPKTGMLMSLTELKKIVKRKVIDKVDHKHLNHDVDFLEGINPTAENVAIAIWGQLEPELPKGILYEVEVRETENNRSRYRGR